MDVAYISNYLLSLIANIDYIDSDNKISTIDLPIGSNPTQ